MNNNSSNGQSSGSAQGPQGAQGAQPMEVGYIGRTATIQIIPSTDLEEEAVHESVTAAASRPEGEPVAAVGLGITPTICDHMQSKMRGSDLLSQFPQERKRHRMVGRTRFLNSQARPSPGTASSGTATTFVTFFEPFRTHRMACPSQDQLIQSHRLFIDA